MFLQSQQFCWSAKRKTPSSPFAPRWTFKFYYCWKIFKRFTLWIRARCHNRRLSNILTHIVSPAFCPLCWTCFQYFSKLTYFLNRPQTLFWSRRDQKSTPAHMGRQGRTEREEKGRVWGREWEGWSKSKTDACTRVIQHCKSEPSRSPANSSCVYFSHCRGNSFVFSLDVQSLFIPRVATNSHSCTVKFPLQSITLSYVAVSWCSHTWKPPSQGGFPCKPGHQGSHYRDMTLNRESSPVTSFYLSY